MSPTLRTSACLAVLLSASIAVRAQTDPPARPQFQVTSVKPNASGEAAMRFDVQPGGRFIAVNIPLKQLIRAAYTLQLYQIVNAPAWVDAERFDISALADRDIVPTEPWQPGRFATLQLMIQSLLADRFKLVAHQEARPTQVYALVTASERAGGTGLAPAAPASTPQMQIGPGTLTARNVPLPQLAELLSQVTGKVVRDETGSNGGFDFDLRWSSDLQQATTELPSIFTAVEEQLGLKLSRKNAPVDHLVIDRIEHPDGN